MKKLFKKVIQIEFGWSIFTNSIQILPSLSIHRGENEINFFRHYFTISIERIVFTGRIQFETTIPRQPQQGEEICSFTSKKL